MVYCLGRCELYLRLGRAVSSLSTRQFVIAWAAAVADPTLYALPLKAVLEAFRDNPFA